MTSRKQKRKENLKAYKAARRENLPNYWVTVTRETPGFVRYTKLVSMEKAREMVIGKRDITGNISHNLKHKYKVVK